MNIFLLALYVGVAIAVVIFNGFTLDDSDDIMTGCFIALTWPAVVLFGMAVLLLWLPFLAGRALRRMRA